MRKCITALLLLCAPALAAGQFCVGNSSFALSGFEPGVNVDLDKLAERYTLELRAGYHDFLAAVEYGAKTWDVTSLDGTSRAFGIMIGLNSPHRRHTRFELCPFLRFQSASGPNEIGGTTWSYTEKVFTAELSAGYLAARSRLWDLVPTATFIVGTGDPKLTSSFGGTLDQYQDFCCGWQTFTALRFGLGLGFSDEVTLVPELAVPLSVAGQKTYAIRARIRLGRGV